MAITYRPSGLSVLLLDDIPALFTHPRTVELKDALIGKEFMCKLPGGQIYYQSKLDLDDDGSIYHLQDPSGQAQTSTKFADTTDLDADRVNYFVLPGGFYPKHNIRPGDIAVILFGIRQAYACFGDVGPRTHLGEGSIALHRELGHETIRNRHTASGGRLINAGIDRGVITLVFPASGNGFGRTNTESAKIGAPLFEALKQEAAAYKTAQDAAAQRVRDLFVPRIVRGM